MKFTYANFENFLLPPLRASLSPQAPLLGELKCLVSRLKFNHLFFCLENIRQANVII